MADLSTEKRILVKLLEKKGCRENGKYTEKAKEELVEDLPAVFDDIKVIESYDLTSSKGPGGAMILCRIAGEFTQVMLTEKMLMFIPIPEEYTKPPVKKEAKKETKKKKEPVEEDLMKEEDNLPIIDDDFAQEAEKEDAFV